MDGRLSGTSPTATTAVEPMAALASAPFVVPPITGLTLNDFERINPGFYYDDRLHHETLQHLISLHPNARGARDAEYGYSLNDMAYVKYKNLVATAMAAINWVRPNYDVSQDVWKDICEHWWQDYARRIRDVLRKTNHDKMKGFVLLDKLEKACNAGNYRASTSRPEGIHYAPWVIAWMPESQRADFETHLEWVLHRIVEVAQHTHRERFGL